MQWDGPTPQLTPASARASAFGYTFGGFDEVRFSEAWRCGMNKLDRSVHLVVIDYLQWADEFDKDKHRISLQHVISLSTQLRELEARHLEALEVIEFYSNGGNPCRDMWLEPRLGYFTGNRAKEFLLKHGSDE